MADRFKKIQKTFVLSDGSVNCYGFRLLTEGYLADKYRRNPIGYYSHQRDGGVLLKWENIRIQGDDIVAEPVINLSHPRGQQTVDEIENGFLNGATMGRIIVVEASDHPDLMLPGQSGPTITKWYNKECSITDIPGNEQALASELFDANDNPINLSDFSNQHIHMKELKLQITADLIKRLNLTDNPDAAAVLKGINDLADRAALADDLERERDLLRTEKSNLAKQVGDLTDAATTKEVADLLDAALGAGKITNELKASLSTDYAKNPTGLKGILDKMLPHQSVVGQLAAGDKGKNETLANLSWTELDRGGHLADLKADNPALYERKFEEKFGVKPKKG